jgi:hypothetical protein
MKKVEYFMYGYLLGYLRKVQQSAMLEAPDFVLLTESNLIISGYIDGFFLSATQKTKTISKPKKTGFRARSASLSKNGLATPKTPLPSLSSCSLGAPLRSFKASTPEPC